MKTSAILFTLFTVGFSTPLLGQTNQIDKSRYTLWNPTPSEAMREMSTDRPDMTETPYTVDAGHFQVEADLFSYSYDRHNAARADEKVETWSYAIANLKVGLCNRVDFQLIIPTFNVVRVKDQSTGAARRQSGYGDMVARLKVNLWGNDEGRTAFGLMPFVKFPTSQDGLGNNAYEGGLILPLAISLPGGWDLGLMAELDLLQDSLGGSHHPEVFNTVALGHDIFGKLGGYVELTSLVSWETGSDWVSTLNVGFTYAVTENMQLDAGINFGLTRAADDYAPFVGISWRY